MSIDNETLKNESDKNVDIQSKNICKLKLNNMTINVIYSNSNNTLNDCMLNVLKKKIKVR